MPNDDEDVEKYLREFRARAVRPLETSRPKAPVRIRRLAAAAVLAVLAGGGAWFVAHSQIVQSGASETLEPKAELPAGIAERKLPILQLTKLAVEDPGKLDALLGQAPRNTFSIVEGKKSMLSTLAKE